MATSPCRLFSFFRLAKAILFQRTRSANQFPLVSPQGFQLSVDMATQSTKSQSHNDIYTDILKHTPRYNRFPI